MTFDQKHLQERLAPRAVRFYERIDSTNDSARQWLQEGAPDGAVVIADEQVRGRGRQGHGWHTPAGAALAVSVILHPLPEYLPRLSMLGALAIADVAEQVGAPEVSIKWPNDVLVGGLKVSGVLPEAAWDGSRLLGVVLGMGVNVRVDFGGTALDGKAISLETAIGRRLSRVDLVPQLLERLDGWYRQMASDAFFSAWRDRLSTPGQVVSIGDVTGRAEAVDETGALLVRQADGSLQRVVAGDLVTGAVSR